MRSGKLIARGKIGVFSPEYSKSYEPSCMTSCEVETSPSVAVEHNKSKTYELGTRGLQRSFLLSPEELGSRSAELIRIVLLQSYTQRARIVASPPIGGSSHKKKRIFTLLSMPRLLSPAVHLSPHTWESRV